MEYFMRRIIQLSVACLAAAAVGACSGRDAITDTGVEPSGGVKFINAVPDTGGSNGLDFRFIDLVENNAQYAVPFRNSIEESGGIPSSTQIQFKNTRAGQRHFRIFFDDPDPAIAQLRIGCAADAAGPCIGDSTMTVESGHNYTAILWGRSQAGQTPPLELEIYENTYVPTDVNASVGLCVINATAGPIDVRQYTGATVPATPTWANVPALSHPGDAGNDCITVPVADEISFNVRAAGSATNLVDEDGIALKGVANGEIANGCLVGTDCDATPGTKAAGSVITVIVFPSSVAGTSAAQFDTPAMSFMWDRRPTRNPGT
jgi:hypothetical protein